MADYTDCKFALQLSQPFYGTLINKLRHTEDENIPTLCVTPYGVRYNPAFMAKLTDDEGVFCIAHEIQHLAWDHLSRMAVYRDTKLGPDGKPYNHHKMNMAADFPINYALRKAKVGSPPDPARLGFQICLDDKYTSDMLPEEIYCLMKDPPGSGGGSGKEKGQGGGGAQALDEHSPEPGEGEGVDANGQPTLPPLTKSDILEAAEVHKSIRGEYPVGMERLLGELVKPKQSPWALLRQFVTSTMSGRDMTTWRRLQRRLIVRRIGYPGRVAHGTGHIAIVVDTSGSIDQKMLNLFGGHMAAIMDDARPELVSLLWVDAKVHRVDEVKSGSDLRRVLSKKIPGGGGTDMREGVHKSEELKADVIIVLTDGYTPFCDSKTPLIWAITTPSVKPDVRRYIHIS